MKNQIRINGKILCLGSSLIMLMFMAVKCNKHKEDFIGPEYRLAASDFQVLSNPPYPKGFYMVPNRLSRSVDFSSLHKDTVRFSANFNNRVTWFIELRGLTSGAKKKFTGLSQQLQTEKALYWTGTSDDLIMFNTGENVEATLSFMGTMLTLKDTINIITKRTYSFIKLVNDFETTTNGTFPSGGPPYWYKYTNNAPDVIWNGANTDKSVLTSDPRIPSGKKYYLLEGTDLQKGYFIEGVGFDKQKQIPLYPNPDSVYFNIYVYGFGLSNAQFQIGFEEDDNLDGIYGATSPAPFSATNPNSDTEDEYDYIVFVNWTGWRLLSIRYSDIPLSVQVPNGTQGNHIHEPQKVQKMGFNINSNPSGGTSKVAFDYPIFTYGAPFDPNN
jgi:hypothetical protein